MRDSDRLSWQMSCGVALMVVVSAAGLYASLAVSHASGGSLTESLLGVAVVLAFCITGAVVIAARPRHRIGWLLLGGGVTWAVGNAGVDLTSYGVNHPGAVPAISLFALGGAVVRDVGWFAVILGLPIFFPTGRIAGPRWRWLTWSLVVVVVASVVSTLAAPDANLRIDGWDNPITLPHVLGFVDPVGFLLSLPFALVVAGGAVAQLRSRWRQGTDLERQQVRFVTLVAGLPVLAGPLSFVPGAPPNVFTIAVLPLPVAIGYAVLARGLYDLRTAVNRTAVWVLLSALVAGIYAVVIVGVGRVLDVGSAAWLPAVAVGVVAVSFAPLRDLLQRGVDRVLFGQWQDPYEVLARLGQRLEATADIDRLLGDATTELAALGLRRVRIENAHGQVLAQSADGDGDEPGSDDEIPLLAYAERVGTLAFRQPAARLRASDRRLLEDLAGHLGGVLHDHRLTQELQLALERVVLAREEERRRLRRDLHDGLGPALAGHLLRLDVIARELEPGGHASDLVRALGDDLRATVLDVRRVVEGLRPPALDELGLAGAVEQSVHRLTAGAGLRVDVSIALLPPLPAAAEVAAFRIVTEAVTNVVRHAQAGWCRVTLEPGPGVLRLLVEDDGVGFGARRSAGNGLHTMRERAEEMRGHLRVTSFGGTRVEAVLPVRTAAHVVAS
ncbi:sensor histidine kinase [Nocardioides cynanchi]|uniref:sensor histidine kinase n=1 Tax=Nocardioides cynanchi TaxID=2558918 RepID=UPI001248A6F9|nr:histidine kinase [Nocardioides cynanchi]